jgi:hypothetical protein
VGAVAQGLGTVAGGVAGGVYHTVAGVGSMLHSGATAVGQAHKDLTSIFGSTGTSAPPPHKPTHARVPTQARAPTPEAPEAPASGFLSWKQFVKANAGRGFSMKDHSANYAAHKKAHNK